MNIFIVTAGSRGDVQPDVVLGKGLKEAGQALTMANSVPLAQNMCREG